MSFITIRCQNCGSTEMIESGRIAACSYCGMILNAPEEDSGFASAPDMQAAENMQFAPPPLQSAQIDEPMRGSTAEYIQPPHYIQEELAAARRKRRRWYALNILMFVLESLLLGIGITVEDFLYNFEFAWGALLVFGWIAAQPVCAFLSGFMRPDDAYSDCKPMFKHRIAQGLLFFLLSVPATASAGCLLYLKLESLFR